MRMPHPLNRPWQQETYDKIMQSDARVIIVQSSTGSGKTAWAAQAACDGHKVISLSHTKSLQAQYKVYDFFALYGKGNYTCLDFDNEDQKSFGFVSYEKPTTDICVISKQNRGRCSSECPYYIDRRQFVNSPAGALNYHKFLSDYKVVQDFNPGYLFLDEGHLLSDMVVDFSGVTLNWSNKRLLRYCDPVIINSPQPLAVIEGDRFLTDLFSNLEDNAPPHPKKGGDVKEYKWHSRMLERIDIVIKGMETAPHCWFVQSTKEKMIVRPLTARFHFNKLFDKAEKIVIMSATIGDPEIFTRELGIGEYEFIKVPSAYPAPMRQIRDLKAPKIGYKASREDWILHSQVIANAINDCPGEWSGIVHSPSKWLSYDLADRLGQMTGRETFVPTENIGTEKVVEEWLRERREGKICVAWNLWEGVNMGEDQICIAAKVPFTDFSEPFDKERFTFDGKAGYQRIANKMVQGLGRNRRGKPEHYGSNRLVAIADGNWRRFRKYIDQEILDSII